MYIQLRGALGAICRRFRSPAGFQSASCGQHFGRGNEGRSFLDLVTLTSCALIVRVLPAVLVVQNQSTAVRSLPSAGALSATAPNVSRIRRRSRAGGGFFLVLGHVAQAGRSSEASSEAGEAWILADPGPVQPIVYQQGDRSVRLPPARSWVPQRDTAPVTMLAPSGEL
eukprot:scaffold1461_cov253-Pinguiococcus_pyrenoidosus.AAC.19